MLTRHRPAIPIVVVPVVRMLAGDVGAPGGDELSAPAFAFIAALTVVADLDRIVTDRRGHGLDMRVALAALILVVRPVFVVHIEREDGVDEFGLVALGVMADDLRGQ